MARRYEEVKPARFTVETVDGVERIRIPAAKNWLALPFFIVWLFFWTIGGVAAVAMLAVKFEPLIILWLAFWAAAWLFVAASVLWQLAGAELVRVAGGDLEISVSIPGYGRSRLYRGGEIRCLAATPAGAADLFKWMNRGIPPFFAWSASGAIKFDYGARTIQAASGLDEAEGRMIVDWLRRRLPPSAAGAGGDG